MKSKAPFLLAICACAVATLPLSAKPIFKRDSKTAVTSIDASTELGRKIQEIMAQRAPILPLGLVAVSISDFTEEEAPLARAQLKISKRLQVLSVVPGSVADRLGFLAGDELIEINGHYLTSGETALEQLEHSIVPQIDWNDEISATIIRDGYGQTLSIPANAKYVKSRANGSNDS